MGGNRGNGERTTLCYLLLSSGSFSRGRSAAQEKLFRLGLQRGVDLRIRRQGLRITRDHGPLGQQIIEPQRPALAQREERVAAANAPNDKQPRDEAARW